MDPIIEDIPFDPEVNPAPAVVPYEVQMALDPAIREQYVHDMGWDVDSEVAFDYVMTQIIELTASGLAGLKEQRITKVSHVGLKLIGEDGVSKMVTRIIGITSKRTGAAKDLNPFPSTSETKFIALYHWVRHCKTLGGELVPSDFTEDKCEEWMDNMRMEKTKEDTKVAAPAVFKFTTRFKVFDKEFENHLMSINGRSGVPLSYVIRKEEYTHPLDRDTNPKILAIQVAALSGSSFREDNMMVWMKLKSVTLNGPAWPFISQFDKDVDGRSAYQALRDHYEGEIEMGRSADEAHTKIEQARYSGEKHNFDYEKYVTLFMENYRVLEDHGTPVDESKKVRDFLKGITVQDSRFQAAIAAVELSLDAKHDFTRVCTYLANCVAPKTTSTARSIGSAGTSDRKAAKKGGKSGKKAGTGTGIDANGFQYAFSPEEWSKLSENEKEAVRKRRAAFSEKKKAAKKRKVAAVKAKAAAKEGSGSEDEGESDGEEAAGKQFGRKSHKKAKTT
jgi:hypothetical protein